jgi:hypothetical protein
VIFYRVHCSCAHTYSTCTHSTSFSTEFSCVQKKAWSFLCAQRRERHPHEQTNDDLVVFPMLPKICTAIKAIHSQQSSGVPSLSRCARMSSFSHAEFKAAEVVLLASMNALVTFCFLGCEGILQRCRGEHNGRRCRRIEEIGIFFSGYHKWSHHGRYSGAVS